jgi:hypothetical protein
MQRTIIEGKLETFNVDTHGKVAITVDSGRGHLFLSMHRRENDWEDDIIDASGFCGLSFGLNELGGEFRSRPLLVMDTADGRCYLSDALIFDYESEDQDSDTCRKHTIVAKVDLKNRLALVTEEVTP